MSSLPVIALASIALSAAAPRMEADRAAPGGDLLTPLYYRSAEGSAFRTQVDRFIACCRKEVMHHPLQSRSDGRSSFRTPRMGAFCSLKGPGRDKHYHPAVDFHPVDRRTNVVMYAAHDGRVSTVRNARKYRQYAAITKNVVGKDGKVLGRIVTLYGHVDLDLDEADGLRLNGKTVRKGAVISRHLYSGTMGGPHLHFEVRYYRAGDTGAETFYGGRAPWERRSRLTEPSAGPWSYGCWDPKVGYGFADPKSHGISWKASRLQWRARRPWRSSTQPGVPESTPAYRSTRRPG